LNNASLYNSTFSPKTFIPFIRQAYSPTNCGTLDCVDLAPKREIEDFIPYGAILEGPLFASNGTHDLKWRGAVRGVVTTNDWGGDSRDWN